MTTQVELERILAVWQDRLQLGYWDIKFNYDKKPDAEKVEAEIHVHEDYDQASIRLGDDWSKWVPREANGIVVHELLHCFERGIKQTIYAGLDPHVTGVVSRAVYELTCERYRHESENMIERLANIIVDLIGLA